jgi:hypothetical protein
LYGEKPLPWVAVFATEFSKDLVNKFKCFSWLSQKVANKIMDILKKYFINGIVS